MKGLAGHAKRGVGLLALAAALISTGCAIQPPVAPGAAPAGAGLLPQPGAQPGLPGQPAGTPPSLGGPGASPGGTPLVVLPAPAQLNPRIEQLRAKYGFKSIKGENATADKLELVDRTYALYPSGAARDLDIVFAQPGGTGGIGSDGSGVWFRVDANGQDTNQTNAAPAGGRITYFGNAMDRWLMVHELGHHYTLWVKPQFGQGLINGLGYQPSQQLPSDPRESVDSDKYQATAVPPTSYPTNYAKSGPQEHIAEEVSLHLLGRSAPEAAAPSDPVPPTFAAPPTVNQLLKTELPSGAGI